MEVANKRSDIRIGRLYRMKGPTPITLFYAVPIREKYIHPAYSPLHHMMREIRNDHSGDPCHGWRFCLCLMSSVNCCILSPESQGKVFPNFFFSIIDSGADSCVFPSIIGRQIGIDIYSGRSEATVGVAGSGTTFYHSVTVHVSIQGQLYHFDATPVFSMAWISSVLDYWDITDSSICSNPSHLIARRKL